MCRCVDVDVHVSVILYTCAFICIIHVHMYYTCTHFIKSSKNIICFYKNYNFILSFPTFNYLIVLEIPHQ